MLMHAGYPLDCIVRHTACPLLPTRCRPHMRAHSIALHPGGRLLAARGLCAHPAAARRRRQPAPVRLRRRDAAAQGPRARRLQRPRRPGQQGRHCLRPSRAPRPAGALHTRGRHRRRRTRHPRPRRRRRQRARRARADTAARGVLPAARARAARHGGLLRGRAAGGGWSGGRAGRRGPDAAALGAGGGGQGGAAPGGRPGGPYGALRHGGGMLWWCKQGGAEGRRRWRGPGGHRRATACAREAKQVRCPTPKAGWKAGWFAGGARHPRRSGSTGHGLMCVCGRKAKGCMHMHGQPPFPSRHVRLIRCRPRPCTLTGTSVRGHGACS